MKPEAHASRRRRWPWIAAAGATALIAVTATGMWQYRLTVRQSQEQVLRADLVRLRDVIERYRSDKGRYPASLDVLVADGYLRRVPEDPITKSTGTWRTLTGAPPGVPSAASGIHDVKSGAPGTALDGTRYADW